MYADAQLEIFHGFWRPGSIHIWIGFKSTFEGRTDIGVFGGVDEGFSGVGLEFDGSDANFCSNAESLSPNIFCIFSLSSAYSLKIASLFLYGLRR